MVAEFRRECPQPLHVDRDAGALHLGQDSLEGELHLGKQTTGATRLDLGIQHPGQLPDGRGLGREVVQAAVQRQLTALAGRDGPPQVALAQAREVSRALPRLHEVRRQRRVGGDTLQVHSLGP